MKKGTVTIIILFGLTGLLNLAEGGGDEEWEAGVEEIENLDGSDHPSSDDPESDTDEEPLGEFFLLRWFSSSPEERAAREAEKERKRQEEEARKQAKILAKKQEFQDKRSDAEESMIITDVSSEVHIFISVGPVSKPYPSERKEKPSAPVAVIWDNPGPDKVANIGNALTTTVIEDKIIGTIEDQIDTDIGKNYFKAAIIANTVIRTQAKYGSAGVVAELPGIVLGFLPTPVGTVYSYGKTIANSYYRDKAIEIIMNEDKYNRAPKRPFRSYDEYEEWVKKNNSDPLTVAEAKAKLNAQMEKMGWWGRTKELLCSGGYK